MPSAAYYLFCQHHLHLFDCNLKMTIFMQLMQHSKNGWQDYLAVIFYESRDLDSLSRNISSLGQSHVRSDHAALNKQRLELLLCGLSDRIL